MRATRPTAIPDAWGFAVLTGPSGETMTRVLVAPSEGRVATVESPVALDDAQTWALVATAVAWRLRRAGSGPTTIALAPELVEPFEVAGFRTVLRTMERDFTRVEVPGGPPGVTVRPLDGDDLDAFVDDLGHLHRHRAARVGLDLRGSFDPAYLRRRQCRADDDFLGCVVDGRIVTRMWVTRETDGAALDLHVNAIDVPQTERGTGLLRAGVAALTAHFAPHGLRHVTFRLYADDTVLAGLMGAQGFRTTGVTLTLAPG